MNADYSLHDAFLRPKPWPIQDLDRMEPTEHSGTVCLLPAEREENLSKERKAHCSVPSRSKLHTPLYSYSIKNRAFSKGAVLKQSGARLNFQTPKTICSFFMVEPYTAYQQAGRLQTAGAVVPGYAGQIDHLLG